MITLLGIWKDGHEAPCSLALAVPPLYANSYSKNKKVKLRFMFV